MVGRRSNRGGSSHDEGNGASSSARTMAQDVRANLERLASDGQPMPRLVAFDLDYTCWPLWVDTHVDPPLRPRQVGSGQGDQTAVQLNRVYDRHGTPLSLYPHVPTILFFLQSKGICVAAASRTSAPDVARQALRHLMVVDHGLAGGPAESSSKPVTTLSLFDQLEIYPGSKITHFQRLHKATGIDYADMIFFDDEQRNAEVGNKLGVHFALVGHSGTDLATFELAIRQWRAKRKARQGDLDAGKELLE